jgi:nucleoside-diphosphate-sugar epimerase
MTALVTWATGLVGSRVLDALLDRGEDVRVLLEPGAQPAEQQLREVDVVVGDVRDRAALQRCTKDVEVVYHLAGLLPGADHEAMRQVNVDGTRALVEACGDIRRLVFSSSVSVYRPAPLPAMWPIREDHPRLAHGNDDLRVRTEQDRRRGRDPGRGAPR